VATEQAVRPRGVTRQRERTRIEEAAPGTPAEETRSLSGEIVGARVSPLEWTLYGAFFVVGAIMRFWDLGSRALHHDESLHATYSWYLWKFLTGAPAGGSSEYHYDPMMHGPYQFHGNALMYLIFGVGNAAARYNAALCGTALIALPFLLRRQLGRVSALTLSALLAFTPAFLYYSRFTREDIYFALWTGLFFVGFIRWLDARGQGRGYRWLYLAAAGFALSWATKESAFFVTTPIVVGFIVLIFAAGYAYQFLAPRRVDARGRPVERREHPLVTTLGDFTRANLVPLIAAFRGTPLRAWLWSAGILAVITVVLFLPLGFYQNGTQWTWGFIPGAHTVPTTDASGKSVSYSTDFLTGGVSYWKLQQAVARGGQPWYYYFLVIPLYEQVALVFGTAGLVYYFLHRRTRFALATGAAFVVTTLLTLFSGGKVADLFALLMIASGVAFLLSRPRSLLVNLFLFWTVATWGIYTFAGEKMPWLTIHILLPTYVVAALYLGHLFQSRRFSAKWLITAVLLALTALVSFRSSVALAYVDGANPTEMLIYTQTSQDVPNISTVVHKLPQQGTQGQVWMDDRDTWPWVWYLRDLNKLPSPYGLGGSGAETATDADASAVSKAATQRYDTLFVGWPAHDYMRDHGKLATLSNYTAYEFKLRWWFPEDGYKAWITTGPGAFLGQAARPSSWGHVLNWWATRTPFDQTAFKNWVNVEPFYVYVRNDLAPRYVPASWAPNRVRAATNSHYTPPIVPDVVPAAQVVPVLPRLSINGATLPQPLAAMRAAAVAANGAVYVTDSQTQRVVEFDPAGRLVTSWGSTGKGPGQFGTLGTAQGPMGIAVAPNGYVYVSDTWNHRVQEFTPSGTFVRAFGTPNPTSGATDASFFGPRQLAVAPNGNIYVADTGNERIQVYSPTGRHLFNIGNAATPRGVQTQLGLFDEPSGVTVDSHGTVYVADYWDKRIQRFTLAGKPLGAYPVTGWVTQDYAEPYLAVDKAGHLFATDAPALTAHVNHVLELDAATGRVIKAFGGSAATGALQGPSGLAVGPDGGLYIADAAAIKLLKVQP